MKLSLLESEEGGKWKMEEKNKKLRGNCNATFSFFLKSWVNILNKGSSGRKCFE